MWTVWLSLWWIRHQLSFVGWKDCFVEINGRIINSHISRITVSVHLQSITAKIWWISKRHRVNKTFRFYVCALSKSARQTAMSLTQCNRKIPKPLTPSSAVFLAKTKKTVQLWWTLTNDRSATGRRSLRFCNLLFSVCILLLQFPSNARSLCVITRARCNAVAPVHSSLKHT